MESPCSPKGDNKINFSNSLDSKWVENYIIHAAANLI